MAYEPQTFTNSTVLTASACNQIEENIHQTRVANIGSGPPNSAHLLAGNLWTKTSNTEWIPHILQGSLQWCPFGAIDTTSNIGRLYGPQMCTDTNGAPIVSSEALVIGSLANPGSWYKIGPNASGSYDIVWSALGEIPSTIDWIRLRTHFTIVTSGTYGSSQAYLSAWTYGSSIGTTPSDAIFAAIGQHTDPNAHTLSHLSTAKLRVNSDNGLEMQLLTFGTQTSGYLFLTGYGYND